MFIKKVVCYDYNYAEYIVSDGERELLCMDLTVPLPNNQEPAQGMTIGKIFIFSFNEIECKKTNEEKSYLIIKDKSSHFKYILRGQIVDTAKSIVKVFGFEISLETCFSNGLPELYRKGDYITFVADRLDCGIEKYLYLIL